MEKKIDCTIVIILRMLGLIPTIYSQLSLIVSAYLTITKNSLVLIHSTRLTMIFILVTWLPSITIGIVLLNFKDGMGIECLVEDNPYFRVFMISFNMCLNLISVSVCIYIIVHICKLETRSQEELVIKRKAMRKVFFYIIGLGLFFSLFLISTPMGIHVKALENYLLFLMSVVLIALTFSHCWNYAIKQALKRMCCCQVDEDVNQIQQEMYSQEVDDSDNKIEEFY